MLKAKSHQVISSKGVQYHRCPEGLIVRQERFMIGIGKLPNMPDHVWLGRIFDRQKFMQYDLHLVDQNNPRTTAYSAYWAMKNFIKGEILKEPLPEGCVLETRQVYDQNDLVRDLAPRYVH